MEKLHLPNAFACDNSGTSSSSDTTSSPRDGSVQSATSPFEQPEVLDGATRNYNSLAAGKKLEAHEFEDKVRHLTDSSEKVHANAVHERPMRHFRFMMLPESPSKEEHGAEYRSSVHAHGNGYTAPTWGVDPIQELVSVPPSDSIALR